MRVTRTHVLALIVATGGLAILLLPGLYQSEVPVSESTPAVRGAEPVMQIQASLPFDNGPAVAPASNHAMLFARIEPDSPAGTPAAKQPLGRIQVKSSELALIAELENQAVDTAFSELLPMLNHDDPAVRRATVESLGDISTEEAALTLTTALSDTDPQVRIAALEGLAAHESRFAAVSIEPYLHDQNAEVRLAAIEALSDLESETAVYALSALLSDQDLTIRRRAVSALGDIGGETAALYLRQARYDPEESVRENAQHILAELEYDAPR